MKRLMIAAALLACACTPPAVEEEANNAEPALPAVTLPMADQAGNRLEELAQSGGGWCTADGAWCVAQDGANVQITHGGQAAGSIAVGEAGDGESWVVWPVIVRMGRDDASALIGIALTRTQMYSGGAGAASQLVLYSLEGGAANETVRTPLGATATIRACFDDADQQQRAGACQDQYSFVTRISLDESVSEGPPKILLETAAGSYPGRVTRNADSLERAPLTQADLVWAQDTTCSYRRTYTRRADGLYAPDQPLPPCTDYLEP